MTRFADPRGYRLACLRPSRSSAVQAVRAVCGPSTTSVSRWRRAGSPGSSGPNGSGKTTTLRMLLGLVSITAGTATFGGRRYVDLDQPIHHVGAVLEATSFHPAAGPRTTSSRWPSGPASRWPGWTRPSTWWDSPTSPGAGWASSHSGCANGCSWPRPCSATPRSSSSTSPRTGSTPRASSGCAPSSATRPRSATPSSSPPTFSPRWRRRSTTWSSSPTGRLVLQTTLAELATRPGTSTGMRIRTPEMARLTAVLDAIPVG